MGMCYPAVSVSDFGLPRPCKWDLRISGMLGSIDW